MDVVLVVCRIIVDEDKEVQRLRGNDQQRFNIVTCYQSRTTTIQFIFASITLHCKFY